MSLGAKTLTLILSLLLPILTACTASTNILKREPYENRAAKAFNAWFQQQKRDADSQNASFEPLRTEEISGGKKLVYVHSSGYTGMAAGLANGIEWKLTVDQNDVITHVTVTMPIIGTRTEKVDVRVE